MLATAHVIIGAAAGLAMPNAPLAFVAGVVSHHLMDMVPHWDSGSFYYPKKEAPAPSGRDLLIAIVDCVIAVWVVVQLLQLPALPYEARNMLWGAVGGIVPDLWHHSPGLQRFTRHWSWSGVWYRFHNIFHATISPEYWWFGVLTQILFAGVAWWSIVTTLRI